MEVFSFYLFSSGRSFWEVIIMFVLFAIIVCGAYYVTYFIAKAQQGTRRNNNMKIVEAISVGQNKSLQLVRLGGKYVVIGVSKTQITAITTLEEEELILPENIDGKNNLPFKSVLDKFRRIESKVDVNRGEEQNETKDE